MCIIIRFDHQVNPDYTKISNKKFKINYIVFPELKFCKLTDMQSRPLNNKLKKEKH
ncbi:hypothetical protein HanRHA438_Chr05g0246001 [Helianthus annuus]|nr:hypothetical protein HanRHA438_Chr05g0246001 [Helianthus annuus]